MKKAIATCIILLVITLIGVFCHIFGVMVIIATYIFSAVITLAICYALYLLDTNED